MSKKITAVEWLAKELESYGDPQICRITWEDLDSLVNQAKAMEKEQMKDCYWYGDYDGRNGSDRNFEQYYNETFKPKQR